MDFEKEILKLKKVIPIKDTLNEGDVIIQASEDLIVYGVVHEIEKDFVVKRGEWWHVTFTMLAVPLILNTLTLRTEQMTGKEVFTVGGKPRFFAALDVDSLASRKHIMGLDKKERDSKEKTSKKSTKKSFLKVVK